MVEPNKCQTVWLVYLQQSVDIETKPELAYSIVSALATTEWNHTAQYLWWNPETQPFFFFFEVQDAYFRVATD